MPGFSRLELKNFRTFSKEIRIEWKKFSVIVGPNGVGKSTVLDAIAFALCLPPYNRMSVQFLKNEITDKNADDLSSWVKVTFDINDKETIFKREADYDKSLHKFYINDKEVREKQYKKRLLEFNIDSKVNNILVHQNSIESFAMKSPKEISEMFEELSGSIEYKSDYNRLTKEIKLICPVTHEIKKNLDFHLKQKRILTRSSKKARQYESKQQQFKTLQFNHAFAKLYQIDRTIDSLLENKNKLKVEITSAENEKQLNDPVERLKEELKQHKDELEKLDVKAQSTKNEIPKYAIKMLQLQEKLSYCSEKIKVVVSNLNSAKKNDEACQKTIEHLRMEYRKVKEEKENYIKSQSQKCSVQLNDDQYEIYLSLKSEAQKKFIAETGLIDNILRECDIIKDKIADYENGKKMLIEKIEVEKKIICESEIHLEQVIEKIKDTELEEEKIKNKINQLDIQLENVIKNAETLTKDIQNLSNEIEESKETRQEKERAERKSMVIEQLKSRFNGVYDRLKNICDVQDERYEVAITKIMGNRIDDIVVDNVETAKNCLLFLKDYYAACSFSVVETFLPLNFIQTNSLHSVSQLIQNEPNARLAVSIMIVTSDEINRAVHHVLGNAVICDTDEEACSLRDRKQISCVSLNGTFYKKSGTVSAGLASLKQKSKQWNEKKRIQSKQEKEIKKSTLTELRKEIIQAQEKKINLCTKLSGLQERLNKYLKPAFKQKESSLKSMKNELSKLQNELGNLKNDDEIAKLRNSLDVKKQELEKIEKRKRKIEDEVFSSFCETFNLQNIREYEEGDFKVQKKRSDREKEFDNHLDNIRYQIKFEKSRDTKYAIERLESTLEKLKADYQILKDNDIKLKEKMKEIQSVEVKDIDLKKIKKKISSIEKNIKLEEKNYNLLKKKLFFKMRDIKAQILNLQSRKHELLTYCQSNNVDIPLCNGTLDEIILKTAADFKVIESSESMISESTLLSDDSEIKERDIKIDYAQLPKSIKKLGEIGLSNEIKVREDKLNSMKDQLEQFEEHFEPNENLDKLNSKITSLETEYNQKLEKLKDIEKKFDSAKFGRCSRFTKFLDSVVAKTDESLKEIYHNLAAQAYVIPKNPEEPYLDGIDFSCIIPGKKHLPMSSLSGAEKTICATAFFLSIFRTKPAPFIFFDEMDAALDNTNLKLISNYFNRLKNSTQIILISHRDVVADAANAVIGIHFAPQLNSSDVIHFDLSSILNKMQIDVPEQPSLMDH